MSRVRSTSLGSSASNPMTIPNSTLTPVANARSTFGDRLADKRVQRAHRLSDQQERMSRLPVVHETRLPMGEDLQQRRGHKLKTHKRFVSLPAGMDGRERDFEQEPARTDGPGHAHVRDPRHQREPDHLAARDDSDRKARAIAYEQQCFARATGHVAVLSAVSPRLSSTRVPYGASHPRSTPGPSPRVPSGGDTGRWWSVNVEASPSQAAEASPRMSPGTFQSHKGGSPKIFSHTASPQDTPIAQVAHSPLGAGRPYAPSGLSEQTPHSRTRRPSGASPHIGVSSPALRVTAPSPRIAHPNLTVDAPHMPAPDLQLLVAQLDDLLRFSHARITDNLDVNYVFALHARVRRPTKLNPEHVFGEPLENVVMYAAATTALGGWQHDLPVVVFACVEELYRSGIYEPGLFCKPVDRQRHRHLVQIFNNPHPRVASSSAVVNAANNAMSSPADFGATYDLRAEPTPAICGLLSAYLAALPTTLFDANICRCFWEWCVKPSTEREDQTAEIEEQEEVASKRKRALFFKGKNKDKGKEKEMNVPAD
ncbi:hypothetical protein PLICRDRAFT_173746, partial [Plicaturopsis crispa FD-325 SS-3]